ncbi:MAG: helix-turn-helix domain-containing protein [Cyclobacteriaceae bacterium]
MINQKSIAVLPFDNLSSDPENEYFSDGMTEEIINALSKINGLKVTARTSSFVFKKVKKDVRHIGNELGVSLVLEGSVRKAGNSVRITTQLIRTDNGFHIWSENFDRKLDDIFALQDEISLLIADKIRETYGHLRIEGHLVEASTSNIEAYNVYLKARFNHLKWDGDGIRKAIELYTQCIEMEPAYSSPYFGLAYCFAMAGSWGPDAALLDLAEQNIKEGFRLNAQSELGYYAQATLSFWGHWDFQKAQENYIKAIQLNPKYTEAEEGLIELYTAVGDFDNALQHVDQILTINPLSTNHFFTKANIFYLMHDFGQAEYFTDQALHLDPGFTHAIALKQLCLIHNGKQKELTEYLKSTPLAERPQACQLLYDLVNETKNIDNEVIEKVVREEEIRTLFPWNLFINAQANRISDAITELVSCVDLKVGQYVNFKNTPLLLPLHNEPEFQRLVTEKLQGTYAHINLVASREDKAPALSKEEAAPYIKRLTELMEEKDAYLDSGITLRSTAQMIDLSPNKLSYLINEFLGINFNDYINGYRLKAFQEKATNPANSHLTLLGLAYESGFTSKSVFNDFFKKKTGLTPKAWVKKTIADKN